MIVAMLLMSIVSAFCGAIACWLLGAGPLAIVASLPLAGSIGAAAFALIAAARPTGHQPPSRAPGANSEPELVQAH